MLWNSHTHTRVCCRYGDGVSGTDKAIQSLNESLAVCCRGQWHTRIIVPGRVEHRTPGALTLMANITIENLATEIFQDLEHAPSISPSLTSSTASASPLLNSALLVEDDTTVAQKKKKKKKPKKRSKAKAEANAKPSVEDDEPSPLVLRISRNKHWRYISSYHVCLFLFTTHSGHHALS